MSAGEGVLAWLEAQIPAELEEDERRRAKAVVRMAILVAPWSPIIGLSLVALGEPLSGAAIGLTALICLAIPPLVWRTGKVTLAAHLLVFGLLQGLFVAAALLGGVGSPPTQWIVLGPVIATATGGVRAGGQWTVAIVLGVVALGAVQVLFGLPTPFLIGPWVWIGTVSAVGLYLLMGLFLRANDQLYRGLLERVRAAELAEREANIAKSAFLANMSHEIRTPLNAVLGYTEMVAEEAEELGNMGMVEDLKRVGRSGTHLLDLVNDILDLSKIEAGKLELLEEDVELSALIKEVVDEVAPLVEQHHNHVQLELSEAVVCADRSRLRQIVLNLLSNAAKFTESGTITVKCAAGRIEVSDTGIGMTAEQAARVFDPFAQAEVTTARKYGGTGLGMAIVRRLLESMGGEIEVQTAAGVGSTFTVTLPVP